MFNRRPKINLKTADEKSIIKALKWFIKNDVQLGIITSPMLQQLFEAGYRPKSGSFNNPDKVYEDIEQLPQWFVLKVLLTLERAKSLKQNEFIKILDYYSQQSNDSLKAAGATVMKYKLKTRRLTLKQINKKVPEDERQIFKRDYMDDCVLSSELRVLAWAYQCTYGSAYKNDSDWKPT